MYFRKSPQAQKQKSKQARIWENGGLTKDSPALDFSKKENDTNVSSINDDPTTSESVGILIQMN